MTEDSDLAGQLYEPAIALGLRQPSPSATARRGGPARHHYRQRDIQERLPGGIQAQAERNEVALIFDGGGAATNSDASCPVQTSRPEKTGMRPTHQKTQGTGASNYADGSLLPARGAFKNVINSRGLSATTG